MKFERRDVIYVPLVFKYGSKHQPDQTAMTASKVLRAAKNLKGHDCLLCCVKQKCCTDQNVSYILETLLVVPQKFNSFPHDEINRKLFTTANS